VFRGIYKQFVCLVNHHQQHYWHLNINAFLYKTPLQNRNFNCYENSKSSYICALYKSNTRLPGTATPTPPPTPPPQPTTRHAQRLYLSLLFGCIQKRAREHDSCLNSRLTFGSDCFSVQHSKEHLCTYTPTNIVLLANYPYTDSSNPTRGDSSKCLLKFNSNNQTVNGHYQLPAVGHIWHKLVLLPS